MNLIREILLKLEAHEHGHAPGKLEIPGYSDEQIGFHIFLMGQARLLVTHDVTNAADRSPAAMALSMTWDGYEFLDAARNDSVWKKARHEVTRAGVSAGFELVKQLLIGVAKDELRKHGVPVV